MWVLCMYFPSLNIRPSSAQMCLVSNQLLYTPLPVIRCRPMMQKMFSGELRRELHPSPVYCAFSAQSRTQSTNSPAGEIKQKKKGRLMMNKTWQQPPQRKRPGVP
ncbi:hypothetical protein FJTKL_04989 [Diaporthe vaccinii]|uniref:Uncharacterized protein n=1 Tax=Diaporthe vaccinii TaxID=105482 RepID=A0ABR4EZ60_9PEZI